LVNKTARVVEEVRLKKIGSDHVETGCAAASFGRQHLLLGRKRNGGKLLLDRVDMRSRSDA
jgi:hypothetical protein